MRDAPLNHDDDPEHHIGEPVDVDYDTGNVKEADDGVSDDQPDPAPR